MSKVAVKKKAVVEETSSVLSGAKIYARKIWLAGLGAYAKAGQEGSEYFKELVKSGEGVENKAKNWSANKLKQPTARSTALRALSPAMSAA